MNIKDYISSGIIESYVLGLASPEESAEFEKLCLENPELVAARTAFELTVEKQMTSEAISPAPDVREKVMSSIRQLNSGNQTKIITMDNARTSRSSSPLGWVAAAAIILLLAAGYFAYDFYNKNKSLKDELAKSKTSQDGMDAKLKQLEMMSDPNVAVVTLKGTEKAPKSSANIYWDSTSANVFLVVKNMPKLANDKQYQLWSILNGADGQLQPTSLGLFDVGDDGKIILQMPQGAKKADAFAITIEKRGNSGGPTLEELQAMGKPNL